MFFVRNSIEFDECSKEIFHNIESIFKDYEENKKINVFYLETYFDKKMILFESVNAIPGDAIKAVSIQFPQILFHLHSCGGYPDGYYVIDATIINGETVNHNLSYYQILPDEDIQEMKDDAATSICYQDSDILLEKDDDELIELPFYDDEF